MAEASNKSGTMNAVLDEFANKAFGRPRSATIAANVCVTCGKPATKFKDALSKREYAISGMCQTCQDSVFS